MLSSNHVARRGRLRQHRRWRLRLVRRVFGSGVMGEHTRHEDTEGNSGQTFCDQNNLDGGRDKEDRGDAALVEKDSQDERSKANLFNAIASN